MSRFTVTELPLPGLKLVERRLMSDARGFLARLFCSEELAAAGWRKPVVQINHTCTVRQGAVRGMHFQLPPYAEMKLVSCLKGEVWDVAVDLRAGSPTFLQWHAERLSAQNARALLIPEGFAHGFQVMSDGAELLYCHSAPYTPQAEAGLHPQDPRLAIAWPLPVADLSQRDATRPFLEPSYEGVIL